MKVKKQRVQSAEISFEGVPRDIVSELFAWEQWTSDDDTRGILTRQYSFARPFASSAKFERIILHELEGFLGAEIERIGKRGFHGELHIGYSRCANLGVVWGSEDVARLAAERRGLSFYCGLGGEVEPLCMVAISPKFVARLSELGLSLSIFH